MPAHDLKLSFNSGELSPLLDSRVDTEKYGTGCRILENFTVRPYGGAFKRPGTQYVGEVKTSTKETRLIAFRRSTATNYVLEFGDFYMRVWTGGTSPAQVAVSSVTAWATATAYVAGDVRSSGGTNYHCFLAHTSASNNQPGSGAYWQTYWTALTGSIFEIKTPYAEADLFGIQVQQINDVMFIAHPSYEPRKLSHTSATNWKMEIASWGWPPIRDMNITTETLTISQPAVAAWAAVTAYSLGDVRSNGGAKYYCLANHTSSAAGPAGDEPGVGTSWPTYWEIISGYSIYLPVTLFDTMPTDVYFHVEMPLTANSYSGDILSGATSTAIYAQGQIEFVTTGIWGGGPISVQESTSSTGTFNTIKTLLSPSNSSAAGRNFNFTHTAPETGAWYRTVCDAAITVTAPAKIAITPQNPVQAFYLRFHKRDMSDGHKAWVEVYQEIPAGALSVATTEWAYGAFNALYSYPSAVTFHENRLWFGGTANDPQRIWGSASNDFLTFKPGTNDDSSIDVTIAARETNGIKWMESQDETIFIGTSGEEWTLSASTAGAAMTPASIQARRRTAYGSTNIQAVVAKDSVMFTSQTGRSLHEFTYIYDNDRYKAPDMTLLAEHLTQSGIVELAVQKSPETIIWAVNNDGDLLGFTYERDQNVVGWHVHMSEAGAADFESITTIYGTRADEVWMIVKRTVGGATKRYIERFYPTAAKYNYDTMTDLFYVDCGLKIAQAASTTVAGLSHLNGKTVAVLADGTKRSTATVSGGSITISGAAATSVIVGLPYKARLQPMKTEIQLQDGTAQGRKFRASRIVARLFKSLYGKYSYNDNDTEHSFEYLGSSAALRTEEIHQHVPADWSESLDITLSSEDPLPLNILALVVKLDIRGD